MKTNDLRQNTEKRLLRPRYFHECTRLGTCPTLLLLTVVFLVATRAVADERLKGKACRSVHLHYRAKQGTVFYNEVTVDQSAQGTYFCVCGFRQGYFGIQELANGKKVAIFSVWDPGKQNNPNAVKEQQRVKLVYQGDQVRVKRFGNEGTGGQAMIECDWKIGKTCRLMVKAAPDGKRTAYSGYINLGEKSGWKHLVTFSTLAENRLLEGYYSFIEDFRRNVESTRYTRMARFGNGWIKAAGSGDWQPLQQARFTGDRNPVMNINAGQKQGRFYLATGGNIANEDVKLWETIDLKADAQLEPPTPLP